MSQRTHCQCTLPAHTTPWPVSLIFFRLYGRESPLKCLGLFNVEARELSPQSLSHANEGMKSRFNQIHLHHTGKERVHHTDTYQG